MKKPNVIAATYVPRCYALAWASGRLSDMELWHAPWAGTGTALFVGHMEGKLAWRAFAVLVREIPPQELIYRTDIPSLVRRSETFGAVSAHTEASGQKRYFADGDKLRFFLHWLAGR